MEKRVGKLTRRVKIGKLDIGGGSPVLVQSMTKTDTRDVASTVKQIKNLEKVGCEIVRVAIPDMAAAKVLSKIKNKINIPLVGDVHFNYRLALEAIAQGVDKLRLNPGNITKKGEIGKIIKAAKKRNIPIRIGINSGSLEKNILKKYGKVTPEAMVESALGFVRIFEKLSFFDIVLSLKAADVSTTIKAYELISRKCDYPLHLGITEAGTPFSGTVKSAVGIGALLFKGIGDTIRVSLTGSPEEEVKVGFEILKSLGLRQYGPTIISCPTCGRCKIPLIKIAQEVEKGLAQIYDLKSPALIKSIQIAIMGCIVNGPGEAKEADIGIAGGRHFGVLFKKGKVIKKIPQRNLSKELLKEIKKLINT